MNPELIKAIAEAKASQEQANRYTEMVAVIQAVTAAQSAPAACSCQHHGAVAPAGGKSIARPLAIGGAVVVGGCVLTGMFLAIALTAVAVSVSSIVMLLLVREVRKQKKG